ncbi:MAG: type II toxin-antitoxin system Phd/YefM family antitoxin [Oscillospiraceae bacterium]|jgi:PHD/YefM family antitoxin component YafN of YafNO toxin-antitoxin module|nr:type II toxin-antitoxin system Phd/YefM family antitoxin [Oscillospiraceae bacterium]
MIEMFRAEVEGDFKKVCDIVREGERVIVRRPRSGNVVILSEKDYKEMSKAQRNFEYFNKLDESFQQIGEGRLVEKTMQELEAMAREDVAR